VEHIAPAIKSSIQHAEKELADHEANIERKLQQGLTPTYNELADALERIDAIVSEPWQTVGHLKSVKDSDQLREVYPELLKRLDDSQDAIRVTVCDALSMFFKCLPPNWSRTLYEYIIRTLFVHLDDPNPQIQQAIYAVLESAAHHDHATFAREAQVAGAKSSHPRLCEELGRLAESLRQASA